MAPIARVVDDDDDDDVDSDGEGEGDDDSDGGIYIGPSGVGGSLLIILPSSVLTKNRDTH